ncbi:AAA family ATPase [Lonepinella sp. BR2357]|uniref:ATP-dependent DNA helicase n=1 Tax=Lonepinella sp. BR2357 TaxID=3434549 RepID=UPI003F6E4360
MKSENFILLSERHPDLASLADDAEKYIYNDHQSALVKLRCFSEKFVYILFNELHIDYDPQETLMDKMNNFTFKQAVPQNIQTKLHLLRTKGNKAAHSNKLDCTQLELLGYLKEAYLLSRWLYTTYHANQDYPMYRDPPKNSIDPDHLELKKSLQEIQQKEQAAQQEISQLKTQLKDMKIEISIAREQAKEKYEATTKIFDLENEQTLAQIKLIDIYNEYELTAGQKELIHQLDDFLIHPNQHVFLLKGYAGTGKTFIMKGFSDYLDIIGRTYTLAAPTGKAAKVLKNKTKKDSGTIHSLIYDINDLVEYKDENQPDTYRFYAKLKANEHGSNRVYIFDESSMISDHYSDGEFIRFGSGYLLKDLMKFINIDQNHHDKKIIFIGDNAQLPPIQMTYSPALSSEYLTTAYNLPCQQYELTDIVRQRGESNIITNSISLRKAINKKEFNQLSLEISDPDIFKTSQKDCINDYLNVCQHQVCDNTIMIAFSNAMVNDYNQAIRQYLFPEQKTIVKNDKIMVVKTAQTAEMTLYNGETGLVHSVSPDIECRTIPLRRHNKEKHQTETIHVDLHFREITIEFQNERNEQILVKTKIIENLLYSDNPILTSDENKALYIDFCIRMREKELSFQKNPKEFKAALLADPYFNALQVKFGYAITCHKAQGSEWENVFVSCQQKNMKNESYFRWLYTAITRSADKLYLIDPPQFKPWSNIKFK